MIISNGYSLSYHPNENQIIINIPQTMSTATTTALPIEDRKTVIEESDLTLLLTITRIIFKNFEAEVDDEK